jgi:DNA-binding transcriptional LysR family regulator
MELRHLRYFVAVAEERNFTRAAERLWLAQPGLSTQIRQLEGDLGVKLLDRHSRGVELTDAGQLFLDRARVALAAADAAGATGRDLKSGSIGRIRLGLSSGPRWGPASELLQRFNRERPGIELAVLEAGGGTLWRDLRDARVDAVIAPIGHASADLKTLELESEPWVVLVGTAHPLAAIGPIAAVDLNGERVAVPGHRDAAADNRAIADVLDDLSVAAELVAGPPGPASHPRVAGNEFVVLTTAPVALPAGVIARRLDPRRCLRFALMWRDEVPSPALAGLMSLADLMARQAQHALSRGLAAVA